MRARYSRWDSSQDPLGADFGVAELLDEMSEDLLTGFGANWSLENIRRKGVPGRARGLDDLRRQLAERRRSAAEELNLSAPLAQVRDELNEILALARSWREEPTTTPVSPKLALIRCPSIRPPLCGS